MSSPQRLVCFLSGLVQGVGFRYYARQWGSHLGLSGYARNLDDGRVHVVAEGPTEQLQQFLLYLRQGPRSGRVDHADVQWMAAQGDVQGFDMYRTVGWGADQEG